MYYLGIDGGGTKTKAIITTEKGKVIAEALVGATNPNSVPEETVKLRFQNLFSQLWTQSNLHIKDIRQVFAGMSGVSRQASKQKMKQLLSVILEKYENISVDNDAVTALYSGSFGKPGIVQISGTGSITYGVNSDGEYGRVGGWGHFIDEKGSGFSIGRDALQAAFKALDERRTLPLLGEFILEHFHEKELTDVIPHVYQAADVKVEIASLSRLVFKAADQGDELALSIVKQQGKEIGKSISRLIDNQFKKEKQAIPVVLAGGIFNRVDLFQETMEQTLKLLGKEVHFIMPEIDPAGGAVVAALKKDGIQFNESEFIQNYQMSCRG
ncbi:N-acetylglucosamine kinase [Virgibacillus halodenitrificans]|uniref:N-acetylglucosamine kinase n=1 Tax=Virgibacillus halodenitrificans TaxID=1482 RepID=UPI001F231DAB|nr:BadF/BadG/BcrA/BcrD ATPase family protein [Virgibacillus halodenitrificans]